MAENRAQLTWKRTITADIRIKLKENCESGIEYIEQRQDETEQQKSALALGKKVKIRRRERETTIYEA